MLAACLLALVDGVDDVDREAAAFVLADSLLMWRRSVTSG